jgi:hypothetical protein
MFVTIVISALIVGGVFGALGLIPQVRPTRADIFQSVKLDYKLVLNIIGLVVFATLFGLAMRGGATHVACHTSEAPADVQPTHARDHVHGP